MARVIVSVTGSRSNLSLLYYEDDGKGTEIRQHVHDQLVLPLYLVARGSRAKELSLADGP